MEATKHLVCRICVRESGGWEGKTGFIQKKIQGQNVQAYSLNGGRPRVGEEYKESNYQSFRIIGIHNPEGVGCAVVVGALTT